MIKTPEALFTRLRLSGRYVYGGNSILRSLRPIDCNKKEAEVYLYRTQMI